MIRLRLLGSLALTREDGSSVRSVLAQPKRFALLAYLASSSGSEGPRDTLLGLFWPDLVDEHARRALRQSLYGLRKSLGPGVVTGKGAELVGVDPERIRCDAAALLTAVEQGRDREALELYDGPFLEGLHLSGLREFERWVEAKRRRLEREATSAAWRLVEVAEEEGEGEQARRWAERAIELAPYDGAGVRRYISLMDRLGQPAAAIRAYEAYAERLAADLDLRPSAETAALVERVRDEDPISTSIRSGASGPEPGDGRPLQSGISGQSPNARPTPAKVDGGEARVSGATTPSVPIRDADDDDASTPGRDDGRPPVPRPWSLLRSSGRPLLTVVGILAVAALVSAGIAAFGVGEGSGAAGPRIRSVAVLPLENYSRHPDQAYFTDGMTEALIAELGTIRGLKVISRTSAMGYKDSDKPLPEIARELGADALIEGSVLKAGDEVRITLQLVHGPTDRHLWAKSYERELQDVLALQGEVARNIAREMRVTLAPETEARLARAETVDPEAYDAYLKGRYRYARVTEEDHRAALALYRAAVAHDSGFAEAYAAMAQVCVHPSVLGIATSLSDCRTWADRAVELAPDLAEAHAALGYVLSVDWDWKGSEAAFRRAIELNPNAVMARRGYSDLLWVTGREEKGLEQIRWAEALDPLNVFVKTNVGWPLHAQGRFDEALAQYDEVLEMAPDFWLPLWNRGEVLVAKGRAREALEAARRLAELPGPEAAAGHFSLRAGGLAVAGEKERAMEVLAEQGKRFGDVMPARIGMGYLTVGREEEALDWLERAFRAHDPMLPVSMALPRADILQDHPRFRALQRKMGLDAYAPL